MATTSDNDLAKFAEYKANPTVALRNAIATRYYDDTRRLARYIYRRYVGTLTTNTDDFVGVAYVTLLKCIEQYDPEKCDSFIDYLCVCLSRRCHSEVKKSRLHGAVLGIGNGETDALPEPTDYRASEFKTVEMKDMLTVARKWLGAKLVKARFEDGLTLEETEKITGLNRGEIIKRLCRFSARYRLVA